MIGNLTGSSSRRAVGRFASFIAVTAAAVSFGPWSSAATTRGPVSEVPQYYVALRLLWHGTGESNAQRVDAVVRATTTGAAIATVAVPRPYFTFIAVSGEADDRTFVLAAQKFARHPGGNTNPAIRFFLLHINPAAATARGRASLTTLPVPVQPKGDDLDGMAVSPDGSKLAVISTNWNAPGFLHARLHVYDMATGADRTWQGQANGAYALIYEDGLSWAANSTTLQLLGRQTANGRTKILLIDVAKSGTSLADSQAVYVRRTTIASWRGAVISGNGRIVAASLQIDRGERVVKINARTGRITATVNIRKFRSAYEQVNWANQTGSTLIVIGAGPRNHGAGIYIGRHYTPIRWSARLITAAW
jgi:hypothetical protein